MNYSGDQVLPDVKKGDSLDTLIHFKKGTTQPQKHYTEGTLIIAMKNVGRSAENEEDKIILNETEGIGTEATRANVIETLKKQEYINIEKNKVLVTPKGETLCNIIKDDEITNAEMTAKWEKYLKKIRNNEGTQEAFLQSIINFINHLISNVPKTFENSDIQQQVHQISDVQAIGICPSCNKYIVDKGKFYGCTGYSDGCKFSLPKKWSNKTIPKKNIKKLIEKKETSLIKGFKSKKDYPFDAKLKLTDSSKLEFVFPEKQRK